MPLTLAHRVSQVIENHNLITPADTVIIGFSGGPDSTALVHILSKTFPSQRLITAYIDHGLRNEEIEKEQIFCQELSTRLHLTHLTRKVDVTGYKNTHGKSVEEAARILRYQALEEIRIEHKGTLIAVGHNADDQVEELLLRLLRGTGLKGLGGIRLKNERIIRPLLAEPKEQILNYLHHHNLNYCTDSSNEVTAFLRNRIRHTLVPLIESSFNPAIRTTISQVADVLREDEQCLEQLAASRFNALCQLSSKDIAGNRRLILNRADFRMEKKAIQRRIIEKICWTMEAQPSFRKIKQLQQLIVQEASGKRFHLQEGLRVVINSDEVVFSYPDGKKSYKGEKQPPIVFEKINDFGKIRIEELDMMVEFKRITEFSKENLKTSSSSCLLMDFSALSFPLIIRTRQAGERMRPLGTTGSKKISRILSDKKIPSDHRHRYPVVVSNDRIVALLGCTIDDSVKITEETTIILQLSWQNLSS